MIPNIVRTLHNPLHLRDITLHWLNSLLVEGKAFQYELSRLLEISAIGLLANPKAFGKGVVVGTIEMIGKRLLWKITTVFGIKPIANPEIISNQKVIYDIVFMRNNNITGPLFEEMIYRGLFQKTVEWSASTIFSCIENEITFGKIKIDSKAIHVYGYEITAKKIAILVSSILFISIHDKNAIALIAMLPASLYYGKLGSPKQVVL